MKKYNERGSIQKPVVGSISITAIQRNHVKMKAYEAIEEKMAAVICQ